MAVQRSPNPNPFNQFPYWFMKHLVLSGELKDFDELAFKLLAYLCHKRGWTDYRTRWMTIEDLALVIGASWRRTKRAIQKLAEIRAIKIEKQKREIRFQVLFVSPYEHKEDVSLDASVEGRHPSASYAKKAYNPAQNSRQLVIKKQANEVPGPLPPWVKDTEIHREPGYVIGADADELGWGIRQ